jgi:hypothetical protein
VSNTTRERLDRIEAAVVGTIGLLVGMKATNVIPPSWRKIVDEEKNGLHQAMLDLIALKKEANVDGHSEQHPISTDDDERD